MLLKVIAATVTLAASSLLLTGCLGAVQPSAPACPDLDAEDFGVQIETTAADPDPLAESVGIGDVLGGTCAYGFESEELAGVTFFIVNPTEDAATAFVDRAASAATDAGFVLNHVGVAGQSSVNRGGNADGVGFLVAYYEGIDLSDGLFTDDQVEGMGLEEGDSVVLGSISIPVTG